MARKQPTPRFEVSINGRKACLSGIAGYGVMNVIVSRVKRKPNRFPGEAKVRVNKAQWSKEDLDVYVGGLDINRGDVHLDWLRRDIQVGDTIVIRVLEKGAVDKPKGRPGRRLTTRSTRTRAKSARAGKRER
jgi:hypothetical protein